MAGPKPQIRDIELQPKQEALHDLVENGRAPWIGAGGGRGAAKSTGIDRIMLLRRTGKLGTIGAIVMRNYDQVKKYHIDPMLRDYPELNDLYHITESKIVIPMESGPPSEIHFKHAESLEDVERVFRSGNYYDLFLDQAEQWSKEELVELKKVVRWKGTGLGECKFVLGFNMGGPGIGFLDKIFNAKEYSENQHPEDYVFIQFNPWDNVEWSRDKLAKEGKTPYWYYNVLTDAQREQYASDTQAGRDYKGQDPALANRDWYGSWKALEGAYFSRAWNEDTTIIHPDQVALLVKSWAKRYLSQDYGKGHWNVTQWHASINISPGDAREILGWEIPKSIRALVTYRELLAAGTAEIDEGGSRPISEQDIAREMLERTPKDERPMVRQFFLSPDAFELSVRRVGQSKISSLMAAILRPGGLPAPIKADTARVDGWALMYNMLLSSKRKGIHGDDCWLISSNCPELKRAIPLLMRDPRNLDDVLKTDTNKADVIMDIADTARYGVKSVMAPSSKPQEEIIAEVLEGIQDPTARSVKHLQMKADFKKAAQPMTKPPDWRRRMEEPR